MYTRASPTDILARKSARRTKVRGQVGRAEQGARRGRPTSAARARPDYRARQTRRLPREDPRAEVGEKVRVGVRVGPVEFKLYGAEYCDERVCLLHCKKYPYIHGYFVASFPYFNRTGSVYIRLYS